ncbi:MAG: phosphomannomutase/phosphoglucomutase [candidate division KSB1 bacterium]|nr:phosphomannomutase/phosphoglucomutase [candidate division KSB1 bacterium]
MFVNPNIFRQYDVRGVAERDLTDEVVEQLGRAFGTFMRRKGYRTLTVGRDVRLSSPRLRDALVQGLAATGVEVIDVGVVPTPVLYFSIVHFRVDGGVMITGSHNPIEYNGFKLCEGVASIYGDDIQELRRLIEKGDFESGRGEVRQDDALTPYLRLLGEKFHFPRRLKLVIDAGNGTAGEIASQLFRGYGHDVVCLYCEPDGRFPNHLPDPTIPEYVAELRRKVVELGADLGIGYDGDADRIGAIDEKGAIIFADRLLALFSKGVLARCPGAPIVFDVKCSQALPDFIAQHGGKPVMWKTGHSLLKAKMKELGAPFAGEMSGHMFFADDYFGFDDALYASLRLVEMVAGSGKKLSELVAEIPAFVSTPEIRVDCPDEDKFAVVDELIKHFRREYEVVDVDGARVLFGDGWGLVRASNTQPVLVLRFEAKTPERLREIGQAFLTVLSRFPNVDTEPLKKALEAVEGQTQ